MTVREVADCPFFSLRHAYASAHRRRGARSHPRSRLRLHDARKAHVAAQGITLDYADDLEGADGQSSGRRITLRTGLSAAEEFSVLVHELAHEQLHHIPDAPRLPKVVRETEAEAVAFIVSEAIGLTTGTAATDYIQLYQGSRETLEASLLRVQQTAAGIIQALTDASDDTDEAQVG